MSELLVEARPYSVEHFHSGENLELADETVAEVFRTLLGFTAEALSASDPHGVAERQNGRTAIVGFSGAIRGYCGVRLSSPAARAIASAMLGGMDIDEDDDSIDDGVGEICNMIAGGWKNRIPELSSRCSLSPPTVISGRDYKIHTVKPSATVERVYKFDGHTLRVVLDYEQRSADVGDLSAR
ncbi:hypothetical protein BH10ACI4_BH10ACI4_16200 [soil metagenome]